MQSIAQFTEGIPRSINNFCFNALSLGCALRERVVGASIVAEVISDLDIGKHLTEVPPRPPLDPENFTGTAKKNPAPLHSGPYVAENEAGGPLTSTQARAYIEQLSVQLRDWKRTLD